MNKHEQQLYILKAKETIENTCINYVFDTLLDISLRNFSGKLFDNLIPKLNEELASIIKRSYTKSLIADVENCIETQNTNININDINHALGLYLEEIAKNTLVFIVENIDVDILIILRENIKNELPLNEEHITFLTELKLDIEEKLCDIDIKTNRNILFIDYEKNWLSYILNNFVKKILERNALIPQKKKNPTAPEIANFRDVCEDENKYKTIIEILKTKRIITDLNTLKNGRSAKDLYSLIKRFKKDGYFKRVSHKTLHFLTDKEFKTKTSEQNYKQTPSYDKELYN